MKYVKGKSGNPGGKRPKTTTEQKAWIKLVALTEFAVQAIEEAVTSGTKDSLPAAIHILDRVWGKPKQQVDANLTGGITVTVTIKEKKPGG